MTWCRWNGTAKPRWTLKDYPAPRPLYNLPELLAAPEKSVLIVEGEKCVQAAQKLSDRFTVTTWSGGAGRWKETDWTPLKNRTVVLLPDADEPGRDAMTKIAPRLRKRGCKVTMLESKGDLPQGYDIADAVEELGPNGATKWVRDLIKKAVAQAQQDEAAAGPDGAKTEIAAGAQAGDAAAGDANQQNRDPAPEPAAQASADAGEGGWQEELLKACENDPCAPFEDDALKALKKENQAEWQRLRAKLKAVKAVSITDLDACMKDDGAALDGRLQGHDVEFVDPEPHADPQDGNALLSDLKAMILKFTYLPDEVATAVAPWIVFTWMHDALEYSPYLNITSASPECGKTQLGMLLNLTVRRPEMTTGRPTPAVLYHKIEKSCPTVILDEADNYLKEYPELRGALNGGTEKETAYRDICEGEEHEVRRFSSFCPKVISGIRGLDPTTLSRCIMIQMERKSPQIKLPSLRKRSLRKSGDLDAFENTKARIVRWLTDNGTAVLNAMDEIEFSDSFSDRQRDGWEAQFAIARTVGGEWPDLARKTALHVIGNQGDSVDRGEELIKDIYAIFQQLDAETDNANEPRLDRISTDQLIQELCKLPNGRWEHYRNDRPITGSGLGHLLGRFEIKSDRMRIGSGKPVRGYYRKAFDKTFSNYIDQAHEDSGGTLEQSASSKDYSDFQSGTREDACFASNPAQTQAGSGLFQRSTSKTDRGAIGRKRVSRRATKPLTFSDEGRDR